MLPVIHALHAELGQEKANEIVYVALRDWMKCSYQAMADKIEGSPLEKWHQISEEIHPAYIDDLEIELLQDNADSLDLNVTGCRFAEYFRQLGEPELGFILNCEADNHIAEIGEPEVIFARTQTKMGGAKYCDFHYRFIPKDD